MSTFKPLGNRILVKRSKALASKNGILLPESAQEKPKEGEVLATGPGKINQDGKIEELSLKVGDKVLFGSYAGTEVPQDGDTNEELLIMSQDDVLAVIC